MCRCFYSIYSEVFNFQVHEAYIHLNLQHFMTSLVQKLPSMPVAAGAQVASGAHAGGLAGMNPCRSKRLQWAVSGEICMPI